VNLPAKNKMAEPHFTMFWHEDIPRLTATDALARPPKWSALPASWTTGKVCHRPPIRGPASRGNDLGIYTIKLSPGAKWTLPAAQSADTRRVLYFFKGGALQVAG